MNTEEKYDLIEKYINQKMTEEEQREFELLIKNDPTLKEEVELHQQVEATLKGEKIHKLRNVLKETDSNWSAKENGQKIKTRTINFRRIITVAATVLLFVMAYQFFFSNGGSISNEQLFADNFQPYQMLLSQRNLSAEEKNEVLENAITAYSKGDFQIASANFQQLSQSESENSAYQFYQAISELGSENNDAAIQLFNGIISASDNPFMEQSRWYLALAYMQKEDIENARKSLLEIQSGQFKYKEAQQILNSIK